MIYLGSQPEIGCNDHYLGKTGREISERVLDHKSVLIPLGLTAAASVPDAGTYTKYYGLGERH